MSVHLTHRGTGYQFRTDTDSDRDSEPLAIAGEGPWSSTTTTPTGQIIPDGLPVVYMDANSPDASGLLHVAVGGDAYAAPVLTGPALGRVGLRWNAGERGKPGINADIQNAAESVRMITDPNFEILGTNASSDDVTYDSEGGILFTTDGADGDEVILLPHLDANQSAWSQWTWGTDKQVVWECLIKTGAAITNSIVWAGLKLTNTEVTATDADQCFFRYENGVNSGKWQAISSIGGADDAADSGVTVAAGTFYRLKIVIAADRTARMYINGVLVETTAALTDATDLIPYIGVAADGAAEAKNLVIYNQSISRSVD